MVWLEKIDNLATKMEWPELADEAARIYSKYEESIAAQGYLLRLYFRAKKMRCGRPFGIIERFDIGGSPYYVFVNYTPEQYEWAKKIKDAEIEDYVIRVPQLSLPDEQISELDEKMEKKIEESYDLVK